MTLLRHWIVKKNYKNNIGLNFLLLLVASQIICEEEHNLHILLYSLFPFFMFLKGSLQDLL